MTNNLNNLKALPEKKRMGTFKRFKSIFTKVSFTNGMFVASDGVTFPIYIASQNMATIRLRQ